MRIFQIRLITYKKEEHFKQKNWNANHKKLKIFDRQ